MMKTLKILCILLKVLMLMRTVIAFSSKDQEDRITQIIPSFKIVNVRDYMSSNIISDQNHSDNVIVTNEDALQEDTTLSPEGIPREPTFPRAFVEFGNKLNKTDIFVTFRWNEPEFTNGVIQKYRVQYWFIENLRSIQTSVDIIPDKILQHKVYDLKLHTMYYFKVQAHNKVGASPYTKFINVTTTHENPVPLLCFTSSSGVHILDIDLQIDFKLDEYGTYEDIAYSALEHKFYGITEMTWNGSWKLMTWDFNANTIETKPNLVEIADFNGPVYNLCIDWVARNLYWQDFRNISKLDLTLLQMGKAKYDNIPKMYPYAPIFDVLPSKGYLLYWLKLSLNETERIIMQSDLDGKNIKHLLKNGCSYPYKESISNISSGTLHIDNMNTDKPLMYLIRNDGLIAVDIYGCRCKLILSAKDEIFFYENYYETFFSFTIDKTNIYLYNLNKGLMYILEKKYAHFESKENAFKRVQKVHISFEWVHKILSLDAYLQPYPSTRCLIPNMKDYHVKEKMITANSIVVNLPEPIPNDGCEKYNLATTIYNISVNYLTCLDNDLNKSEEFNVQTYERHYEFQNLTPFTEYTLKLALSNFYFDKLSIGLQFGADVKLATAGKLNAPKDVRVRVLTPILAAVYWKPLKKLNCVAVNYEVHWTLISDAFRLNSTREVSTYMQLINQPEQTVDGKFFTIIRLLPGQKYLIYMRVYPTKFRNFFTDSSNKNIYMYSEPYNLTLSGRSTNSMNISWVPTVNPKIHYKLEYKNGVMQKWQIADNFEINNNQIIYYIKNLLPRTLYQFRLILRYPDYKEDFIWPSNERFTFETLGDVPSAPGIPTVTKLPNFTYHLKWEPVQAHDSQVTLYRLEGLNVENNYKEGNQTDKNDHWNLYYNGTNNYWIITRDMNQKYRFRVRAENAYGFGGWSESTAVVDLSESIEISVMQYYLPLILSLIVILVICNVYYFYCSYQRRKESNEQVLSPINELVTLYEIRNVQFNPLYAPKLQCNSKEFSLTNRRIFLIEKKQIILGKLLGNGAFGKVFQGIVKDFEKLDTTPVAIKMVRENASSQEKKKFLQEAKLMSHFRHKHVLRLLGICLDADSPWLILELMGAGDLLQYLRESRTLQPADSHALRLQDLLAMCEDVARGCCYLEKQHFVHRDLACRNCLISARNRENRIVKIGDFGLARDIYRDHYYRMEGKGLLPVRWMAPESLVIGIFTSQSDVWAFGVLMWEITSLGEEPYAAKNNSEVLQYVREGGKLPKPLNCPPTLYQLMQCCWNAMKDRPNFILCLKNIVTLRDNIEDTILSSVDIIRRAEHTAWERLRTQQVAIINNSYLL